MQLFEYLKGVLQTSSQATEPEDEKPVRMAAALLMVELSRLHQDLNAGEVARTLLARASSTADRSADLYHYRELLRTHLTESQREQLLESLWTVALADRRIDHYEEQYIAKISGLLAVPNVRHLAIKSRMIAGDQS